MATQTLKQIVNFLGKVTQRGGVTESLDYQAESVVRPLVKSRPMSLEKKYTRAATPGQVRQQLHKLREGLYRFIEREHNPLAQARGGSPLWREAGRLENGRSFFYVQPLNHEGFLFEEIADGWQVVRATKVVASASFLRQYDLWDRVNLLQSDDGHIRLNSHRFNLTLASPLVYSERLAEFLLSWATPENHG